MPRKTAEEMDALLQRQIERLPAPVKRYVDGLVRDLEQARRALADAEDDGTGKVTYKAGYASPAIGLPEGAVITFKVKRQDGADSLAVSLEGDRIEVRSETGLLVVMPCVANSINVGVRRWAS